MKTYTQSDMILHEGETYLITENYSTATILGKNIFATTDKSVLDVKQLNRNHFVKPKEDVRQLANEQAKLFYHEPSEIKSHFKLGYIDGYKANKAEFTIEELKTAWAMGVEQSDGFDAVIKLLRPLSLPEYIVIDNDEIVDLKW